MRLDKFLKVSRIIKRRTVAGEACKGDRVLLNGKEAKPSKEVKVGDRLTVLFGDREYTVEVTCVPTGNVSKDSASDLYKIV